MLNKISLAATMKIRSKVKHLIRKYFQDEGFISIDTPILTTTIKDISTTTFRIESPPSKSLEQIDCATKYFGHPVYLSTSPQLHLQTMTSGLNKVYSEGPLFTTNSRSGKNAYEYWNFSCEEAHLEGRNGLNYLIKRAEIMLKKILTESYQENHIDLKHNTFLELFVSKRLDTEFPRITYQDAIEIMKKTLKPRYCEKISSRGKTALSQHFDNIPVFITDFPINVKSFNCSYNENTKTVNAFMLLLPGVEEVISGAIRETNHELLMEKLKQVDADEYYSWFSDTHKWGSAHSGGFTLGLDRLLSSIMAEPDIKKLTPFPQPGLPLLKM